MIPAPTPTRNPAGIAAGAVFLLGSGGLLAAMITLGPWPTSATIAAASGVFLLALVGAGSLASAMTKRARDHLGRPLKHDQ